MSQHERETEPEKIQGFDSLFTLLKKRIGQVTTLIGLISALVFLVVTKFTAIQQELQHSTSLSKMYDNSSKQDNCVVLVPQDKDKKIYVTMDDIHASMLPKTTTTVKMTLKNNCPDARKVYFALNVDLARITTAQPPFQVDPPFCQKTDDINPECWKRTLVEPHTPMDWSIPAAALRWVRDKDNSTSIPLSWWLYEFKGEDDRDPMLSSTGDATLNVLPDAHR